MGINGNQKNEMIIALLVYAFVGMSLSLGKATNKQFFYGVVKYV